MSILQAMYSGVSGIQAEGEALGVVGDNISNVNTVGFKAQRAVFEDMLGHSISAGTSIGSAWLGRHNGRRSADVHAGLAVEHGRLDRPRALAVTASSS